MIKVSDSAKKKVIELMDYDGFNFSKDFVRVGVKSGGCSGLSYDLTFDHIQRDNDTVFEDNEVKIIVDKKEFSLFGRNNFGIFWRFEWQRVCV